MEQPQVYNFDGNGGYGYGGWGGIVPGFLGGILGGALFGGGFGGWGNNGNGNAATKSEVSTALSGKVNTYEVNDIEALSATMLNKLKAGDVVIKKTGSERHAYRVAYKDDTKHECALVYCDAWNVEELYYDKSVGSAWSLIEKQITAIATPNATPNE